MPKFICGIITYFLYADISPVLWSDPALSDLLGCGGRGDPVCCPGGVALHIALGCRHLDDGRDVGRDGFPATGLRGLVGELCGQAQRPGVVWGLPGQDEVEDCSRPDQADPDHIYMEGAAHYHLLCHVGAALQWFQTQRHVQQWLRCGRKARHHCQLQNTPESGLWLGGGVGHPGGHQFHGLRGCQDGLQDTGPGHVLRHGAAAHATAHLRTAHSRLWCMEQQSAGLPGCCADVPILWLLPSGRASGPPDPGQCLDRHPLVHQLLPHHKSHLVLSVGAPRQHA